MKYRLKITDKAAEQLLDIARWYLETSRSFDVAATWYDGFLDALDSLEQNPWRGPIAPENDLFNFELRELHYGSGKRITHRALYRVVATTVEVLAVRHHAERPLGSEGLQ